MKGIILFDNLNDLAFIDADEELILHIQHLAFKDGLLQVIIVFFPSYNYYSYKSVLTFLPNQMFSNY